MKPLLRVVLVINALIFLAFGVLFLLTPWTALWASMHLVTVQPPFVGQLFGGGAHWYSVGCGSCGYRWRVDRDGRQGLGTCGVVVGTGDDGLAARAAHARVTGFGQVIAALVGAVMLVLGLWKCETVGRRAAA